MILSGIVTDVASLKVRRRCNDHIHLNVYETPNCWFFSKNYFAMIMMGHSERSSIDISVLLFFILANQICHLESFNAGCGDDEEIVITASFYGEAAYGDFRPNGYVGCNSDVLTWISAQCTGRQSCDVTIPGDELHGSLPCPSELKMHMEIGYLCVPSKFYISELIDGATVVEVKGSLKRHGYQSYK